MAVGKLKEETKAEIKKPEGFDDKIKSKAMVKLYQNKKQFDNSANTRKGR